MGQRRLILLINIPLRITNSLFKLAIVEQRFLRENEREAPRSSSLVTHVCIALKEYSLPESIYYSLLYMVQALRSTNEIMSGLNLSTAHLHK